MELKISFDDFRLKSDIETIDYNGTKQIQIVAINEYEQKLIDELIRISNDNNSVIFKNIKYEISYRIREHNTFSKCYKFYLHKAKESLKENNGKSKSLICIHTDDFYEIEYYKNIYKQEKEIIFNYNEYLIYSWDVDDSNLHRFMFHKIKR